MSIHSQVRRGFATIMALAVIAAIAWIRPAGAIPPASLTVSDDAPSISPAMTFTYILTKARAAAGDNLIRIIASSGRPAGFPAWNILDCASLLALTTITFNGTEIDKAASISTSSSVCAAGSVSILLVLTAGAPDLAVGDTVAITFASGVFNNPLTATTGTWKWNTSNSSGGDRDEFEATLTSGGDTFSTSTTSTIAEETTTTLDGGETDIDTPGGGVDDTDSDDTHAEATPSDVIDDLGDTGLGAMTLAGLAATSAGFGVALRRRARSARA